MHLANVGLNLAVALAQVPPKTLTQWLSDGENGARRDWIRRTAGSVIRPGTATRSSSRCG